MLKKTNQMRGCTPIPVFMRLAFYWLDVYTVYHCHVVRLSINKTVFIFLILFRQHLCSLDQMRKEYNGLCPGCALTGWSAPYRTLKTFKICLLCPSNKMVEEPQSRRPAYWGSIQIKWSVHHLCGGFWLRLCTSLRLTDSLWLVISHKRYNLQREKLFKVLVQNKSSVCV